MDIIVFVVKIRLKKTKIIYMMIHCKNISIEEARKRIANNEKYTIRQTINKTGTTTFNDAVYGTIEYENSLLDEGNFIKE